MKAPRGELDQSSGAGKQPTAPIRGGEAAPRILSSLQQLPQRLNILPHSAFSAIVANVLHGADLCL
jgi:hypothetical protein